MTKLFTQPNNYKLDEIEINPRNKKVIPKK